MSFHFRFFNDLNRNPCRWFTSEPDSSPPSKFAGMGPAPKNPPSGNSFNLKEIAEMCGRFGLVAAALSMATVVTTAKQLVPLCANKISVGPRDIFSILKRTMLYQTSVKTAQLGAFVGLQRLLSYLSPETTIPNTATAYVIVAVPTQTMLYTNAVEGTLEHFNLCKKSVIGKSSLMRSLSSQVRPGLKPTLFREFGATGLGLALQPYFLQYLNRFGVSEKYPLLSNLSAGAISGTLCGLGTQWLHNLALKEAEMVKAFGHATTRSAAQALFKKFGFSMFWRNSLYRVPTIIAATAIGSVTYKKYLATVPTASTSDPTPTPCQQLRR